MHSQSTFQAVLLAIAVLPFLARASRATVQVEKPRDNGSDPKPIAPKVMIVSMFDQEGDVWYGIPNFNLLAHNVTVPGLSPLFPAVHCTEEYNVCQLTTGEGEINAAGTIASLVHSDAFNLTKTYFMIAGIAGISPYQGTSADVTFARYAVQVALQYELDAREKPDNLSTGYFPQGSYSPEQYPQELYGTEVFEVNDALRKIAVAAAKQATLNDTAAAQAYRANYAVGLAARSAPSVRECDVATSDNYFYGALLGEAFSNYTHLATNGSGVYCTTAQEDNATMESLLRGAAAHLVDFARIIVMRTASDFDRPYPGQSDLQGLLYEDPGSLSPSLDNIYLAGIQVVNTILSGWESASFDKGIVPTNYIGDIYGTLGGTPDFGNGNPSPDGIGSPSVKRSLRKRKMYPRGVRGNDYLR